MYVNLIRTRSLQKTHSREPPTPGRFPILEFFFGSTSKTDPQFWKNQNFFWNSEEKGSQTGCFRCLLLTLSRDNFSERLRLTNPKYFTEDYWRTLKRWAVLEVEAKMNSRIGNLPGVGGSWECFFWRERVRIRLTYIFYGMKLIICKILSKKYFDVRLQNQYLDACEKMDL